MQNYNQGYTSHDSAISMGESQIKVSLFSSSNYRNLLTEYDQALLDMIGSIVPPLLEESLFLFDVTMQPEMVYWKYADNKVDCGRI